MNILNEVLYGILLDLFPAKQRDFFFDSKRGDDIIFVNRKYKKLRRTPIKKGEIIMGEITEIDKKLEKVGEEIKKIRDKLAEIKPAELLYPLLDSEWGKKDE